MKVLTAILVFAVALAVTAAEAATVVGAVSRIKGESRGLGETGVRQLSEGAPVHLAEIITTAVGARLEITFDDGTVVTLGERAKLTIDTFVYRPRAQANALKFATVGAFRFVSGKLTKAPASTASVTTPVATIAIRGTDFWGGPIDGAYGVFLGDGAVSVAAGGGETILDQPGEGVTVTVTPPLRGRAGGGASRGPVTQWPAAKVNRALATVSFE
jgi:hypothetical protein